MNEERAKRLKEKYAATASMQTNKPPRKMGHGGGPGHMMPKSNAKPKNTMKTIKRLFSYLGKDSKLIVFVLICVVLTTLLSLTSSYILRPIINGLTTGYNIAKLRDMIFVMLSLYALSAVFQYMQMRIMVKVSQSAIARLREDLFKKLQRLPVRYFDLHASGDLMSRFTNDVDSVGEMLNNTLVQVISSAIQLVGTLTLMIYTNITLSIVTIIATPLLMMATKGVVGLSRKYYKLQQESLGTLNGYIEETVSGQRVVKVFNHEDMAKDEFAYLNQSLREKQVKAQFFGSIMGPVMGNIGQFIYVLVASIGGVLCVLRGFDIGGLTVFVNYARQFSRPVSELAMQTNTIFSALAGAERVFTAMDEIPESADEPNASNLNDAKGIIKVENISFGYNPSQTVLKNISFTAKQGERIAFVGSTGAGKTTITNLINRFYDIDEGHIYIDGINIKNIKRDELRKHIAMVLQDTHLFSGTIRENIRFGRLEATDEEVINAAKVADAHSFIMRLENGYDTVLVGDGSNLSQGQRQLLNIARAAISNAPILILDEATSSVDTRTERHIEQGLARIMEKRTTLVIAHRLSTVVTANQIIVLEHGEIIERGTHDELLNMKGRYYQLYNGLLELQ